MTKMGGWTTDKQTYETESVRALTSFSLKWSQVAN
jgi:hypothetical protein